LGSCEVIAAFHSRLPKLPVSPLALPPPALRIQVAVSMVLERVRRSGDDYRILSMIQRRPVTHVNWSGVTHIVGRKCHPCKPLACQTPDRDAPKSAIAMPEMRNEERPHLR
jgi:hypothetical protein